MRPKPKRRRLIQPLRRPSQSALRMSGQRRTKSSEWRGAPAAGGGTEVTARPAAYRNANASTRTMFMRRDRAARADPHRLDGVLELLRRKEVRCDSCSIRNQRRSPPRRRRAVKPDPFPPARSTSAEIADAGSSARSAPETKQALAAPPVTTSQSHPPGRAVTAHSRCAPGKRQLVPSRMIHAYFCTAAQRTHAGGACSPGNADVETWSHRSGQEIMVKGYADTRGSQASTSCSVRAAQSRWPISCAHRGSGYRQCRHGQTRRA